MTLPSIVNSYTVATGTGSNAASVPVFINRAPTLQDINYPLGKTWINQSSNAAYILTSFSGNPVTANWLTQGSAGGALNTLSDGSTTVNPTSGNIEILGTASQITSTGTNSPGAITLSLPSSITTPGSLVTTTTLASGTTLTAGSTLTVTTNATIGGTLGVTGSTTMAALSATTGSFSSTLGVTGVSTLHAITATGTVNINASGAGVTTIGTGGTGATDIGNATGNTAVTGSLTTSTTLTATLGNITATNGNLNLAHTGNKLLIHASTAASDAIGVTAAMTAGTITVDTTAVTANSIILLTAVTPGGTQGVLSYGSITAGTSFVITSSSDTDTSTVAYLIIN